jgi:hypothetical protein
MLRFVTLLSVMALALCLDCSNIPALIAGRQQTSEDFSEAILADYDNFDDFYNAFVPLTTDNFEAKARGIGTYGGVSGGGRLHALEYVALSNYNLNGGAIRILDIQRIGAPTVDGDTISSLTQVTFQFSASTPITITSTFVSKTVFASCTTGEGEKIDKVEYAFPDEPLLLGLASRDNDLQLCTEIQEYCVDANKVYDSVLDCVKFFATLPEIACDDRSEFFLGSSKACRYVHHIMARLDPDVHCPHVSKTGGGKCVNENCKTGLSVFADNKSRFTVNFNNGNRNDE